MDIDSIQRNVNQRKSVDDLKTAAEHGAIIGRFQQTGCLDREDAIKKYNEFNVNHPEYYASMSVAATASGTATYIWDVSDRTIVENLQKQLLFLAGKKLSEGANHAQSTT